MGDVAKRRIGPAGGTPEANEVVSEQVDQHLEEREKAIQTAKAYIEKVFGTLDASALEGVQKEEFQETMNEVVEMLHLDPNEIISSIERSLDDKPPTDEEIDAALIELQQEVPGNGYIETSGDDQPEVSQEGENEEDLSDLLEYTNVTPETQARRKELLQEMKSMNFEKRFNEIHTALEKGDSAEAAKQLEAFLNDINTNGEAHLSEDEQAAIDDVKEKVAKAQAAETPEEKSKWFKIACEAADFIPVAGPLKMVTEASMGKTLSGEKLEGWHRALHMTEGVVFTLVDLTGAGVLATKAGKGGVVAGKLVTRSAAFLRLNGLRKESKVVYKVGTTLIRNPGLNKAASKVVTHAVKARKARLKKVVLDVVKDDKKADEVIQKIDELKEKKAKAKKAKKNTNPPGEAA